MHNKQIVAYYTSLAQSDLDALTLLVSRAGYAPVLQGIGDILTQRLGAEKATILSVYVGMACAAAEEVDRDYPPTG